MRSSETRPSVARVCNSNRFQLQQPKTIRGKTRSGAGKGTKTQALALLASLLATYARGSETKPSVASEKGWEIKGKLIAILNLLKRCAIVGKKQRNLFS